MHTPSNAKTIPIKLYRGSNRLVLAAPMAGMEPEDILVEVTADGELATHGGCRAAAR